MGENEGWADSAQSLPNGLLPGAGPVMQAVDRERWLRAEERTAQLISCIQPNQLSEERRNAVADYVQRLITKCFPCQVCTFGSVPLKTYLPDGDIDLTAFSHNQTLKDTWASQVRDMLENEERNENAQFHVKEVQYIQAEVKIIKCLVENIVVDISFNQVGGLCTLCFLDEVDNVINQNHLFKRSIILIKAWCYYESRILGAHHGLISTYALETLVLYIFHVFNNSFHGPLEVLYRFLEFFSNFDWDNFCVSLWGPVPISCLPDVTAEPPRKDSGQLLLSKVFLDSCSSAYAVFPAGQESNGQPFVSKHFNVIDPLRVNNNLGRSVSKGNFFRIRSAFAFGAKKLARLLVCPKEDVPSEVNQFFMNTWVRHGSGNRPDAPGLDSWHLRLSSPNSPQGLDNSINNASRKYVIENSSVRGLEGDGIYAPDFSSQHDKYSAQVAPNAFSTAAHTHSLKNQLNSTSLQVADRIGRDTTANQVEVRDSKPEPFVNETQGRYLFARTRSSPELTETYADVSSEASRNKAESVNVNVIEDNMDDINRRKNLGSESLASHSSRSSVEDSASSMHVPSPQNLDAAADSHSVTQSYRRKLGSDALSEEFATSSGAQMHQDDQDLVNMMASTSLQGFNGQFHVPLNLNAGQLPFPIPPAFLASMGYNQRNFPGFLPANMPFIDPSFSNMQFPHGLVPPQFAHYFPNIGLNTSHEDLVEKNNENVGPAEMKPGEADNDFWQEQDVGSPSGYSPENGDLNILRPDDKPTASVAGSRYRPPFVANSTGFTTRLQQKHSREKHGSVQEKNDNVLIQDSRGGEVCPEERSTSSRLSLGTQNNSLRSRTSSESSWDGSVKTSKSSKEKRGKKLVPTDLIPSHGKGKVMSEHLHNQGEGDDQEWDGGTEMVESHALPESISSFQMPRHHMPGFEIAQVSGSESMIHFPPMLIGPGSRQRATDNSGLIAFYPTGPPIPFVTYLPLYNVPPEPGTSEASNAHFGGVEPLDNSESEQIFAPERCDQSENLSSPSSLMGSSITETPQEQKSDILNSDFVSHWQNLQVGRLCQDPRYQGPVVYPSPVMVPPVYLQGRSQFDNPGRPPTNANIFSQLMTSYGNRMVPVAPPLQSVSGRPPNIYQRYVDDMPRYRSGTGTYLPTPVPGRDRHSSGNRRGNYNHDRNDNYGDREGNWNSNLKPRGAPRSNSRVQTDKSNSRSDRLASNESRAERPWRHDSGPPYQSQNGPSHSHASSSQNGPQNVPYSMFPLSSTNTSGVSNGPVPPVMMFHPFEQSASYGSHGEQLEFGSIGLGGFPSINEQSHSIDGTRPRAYEDHRLHGNAGHRSSPDPPSSPRHQREYFQRNRR